MGEINKDWFTERLRSIKLSQRQQPEDMLDRFCVAALVDGALMTAIIKRGYKRGTYNLILMPEREVLENKPVAWAARVLWIQPT